MEDKEISKLVVDKIPSQLLDLMLDVILEVMHAECGSIMLADDKYQDLTIKSARGLRKEIVEKARVRLGTGISGKVAASGEAVLLKGASGNKQANIESEDLVNPEIDTSYIMPIRFQDGIIGTININSTRSSHEILADKGQIVQGILYRFLEYLDQAELPVTRHEPPTQLYMMNVFREFSAVRELRVVFDVIFKLFADLLGIQRKGVFLLENQDSGILDLVLGYGFERTKYREIYEELLPQLREPRFLSSRSLTVFNCNDVFPRPIVFIAENACILIPILRRDETLGLFFLFAEEKPTLSKATKELIWTICEIAAKTIEETVSGQRFHELTFTDSLTGTYNYGLWWKRLNEEFSRAKRLGKPRISLIVLDIDRLNSFNQEYGYFMGDQLLRSIGDCIKNCLRINDIVGRIGGDEFGLILPDVDKKGALKIAKRVQRAVSDLSSGMPMELSDTLTLSGGLAGFPEDADNPEKLIANAKTALVSAKILGSNHIKCFKHIEE
jgi:diguanylate cyclase (GGDEF)-like protein